MRAVGLVAATSVSLGLMASPASVAAVDSVYWTNYEGSVPISHAGLDGSNGGDLPAPGAPVAFPVGIALDPAAGKVYWSNLGAPPQGISWANLDGSGGGTLNTAGASLKIQGGLSVDEAAGRIYWSNGVGPMGISYANLDGSGGGDLSTSGATMDSPDWVAVDPAAGRVYWTNFMPGAKQVSYANLDGSGGGDLIEDPSVNGTGIVVNPRNGNLYWGSLGGPLLSATPAGALTGAVNLTGASIAHLRGIAIDPISDRVVFINESPPATVSYAALDNSGGADLPTPGATLDYPVGIAILRRPSATAAPVIGGSPAIRSTLSCSLGGWAADFPSAQFYRAPHTFSYQWLVDGAEIGGATAATYVPPRAGSYSCAVTAANASGSTTQTSAATRVPRGTAFAARIARVRRGKALLKMRCGNTFCEGLAVLKLRKARIGRARFSIAANGKKTVGVKLKRAAKKRLVRAPRHRLKIRLVGPGVKKRPLILKK